MKYATLVRKYRNNFSIIARGHYLAADELINLHNIFGVLSIVFSVFLGATILASVNNSLEEPYIIAIGIGSLFTAILSSLQTFLRFSENANLHKSAGARYASIRRRLEVLELQYAHLSKEEQDKRVSELDKLLITFTNTANTTPKIPKRHYNNAEKEWKNNNPKEDMSIPGGQSKEDDKS